MDLGWGSSSKTAPGSLSVGSPAGRTPPNGDGSMYSQANERAGKWPRPPPRALPSVIVDTEKVLREADGPGDFHQKKSASGGKVFAPGCASKLDARTPSIMSSSASTNPGGTSYGHHEPEQRVLDDSAGKPAAKPGSNYAQEYGSSQSSQVWKRANGEHDRSGRPESWDSLERVDPLRGEHLLGRTAHSARNEETIHERTGQPDSENVQGKVEKFIVGSDTTEFVNKVKNQVRIRQKRMSSDVAEDCTEHSTAWRMFMATTLNAATFMGKSYSTMRNVLQNEKRITLNQMFDITAQMINNDEEIYCLDKIEYQRNIWTKLSLINDPVVIGLQSTKVYVFSDSVLCLGKVLQHPECNEVWKNRVAGVRAEKNYSDFDDVKGESAEFEWNIFPGFTTLQLCDKNQ